MSDDGEKERRGRGEGEGGERGKVAGGEVQMIKRGEEVRNRGKADRIAEMNVSFTYYNTLAILNL